MSKPKTRRLRIRESNLGPEVRSGKLISLCGEISERGKTGASLGAGGDFGQVIAYRRRGLTVQFSSSAARTFSTSKRTKWPILT